MFQGGNMDIAELLAFSVKNNASDLHLSSGLPPMIRVDGDIRRLTLPALDTAQLQELVYSTMSDAHRRDFEANLEVDYSYAVQGLARFRVNCFHHDRGVGGAFRTIPDSVWTLEDVGAPPIFRDIIDVPRGLVLLTGPTGSGKSTTLAALIDHLNNKVEGHILTIEDPIEFVHKSKKCVINQREIHRDTHGFNQALRSSAPKTIDRIIDVFPAGEKSMVRSMLSESLRSVITQALMKRIGGGRVAAWEIMVATPAIRNLIREDKVAQMYSSIQTEEAIHVGAGQMNVVDGWLKQLHEEVGSDLFVTVDAPPCIKVHGKIKPISTDMLTAEKCEEIVLSIMSERQKEEFRNTQECQFAYSLGRDVRYRVSAFLQQGMIGMVCRRIETRIPGFEELGCPDVMSELSLEKRGIVLFVGATGTGKSTSMAAMVGYRNQRMTGHIITIEDPIEYVHMHGKSLVTQREVGIDTESFEVALRNTLRQAPDVILIGEIRTRETMEHAITFAETGHLVLATLHANNANQAMDRILHFFPDDFREQLLLDLSFNLKATIAQQLIPSVDGSRRLAAFEVMMATPLVKDLLRKGEIDELKLVMRDSGHHGMNTFDQAMFRMYKEGKITYDDALRYADSANEVRLMIKLDEGGDAETLAKGLEGVEVLGDNF
jgi:twitching motility protein PilU